MEFIGGQIGMLTPLVFLLAAGGVWAGLRAIRQQGDPARVLLLLLTLLPLPVFIEHVLTDRVQANWPAIVYPSAILLGVAMWARLHRPALALGFALIAPVYLQAAWPVLPIPPKLDPSVKRLAGWDVLARDIEAARHADGGKFIAADNYPLAAMLAWHLRGPVPVIGAQNRWASFALPHPDLSGQPGLLVRGARAGDNTEARNWGALTAIGSATRRRGHIVAEEFRLYRVTGPAPGPHLVALPRH